MIILYCMLGRAQRALLLLLPTPNSKSNPWNGRGYGETFRLPQVERKGCGETFRLPQVERKGVWGNL